MTPHSDVKLISNEAARSIRRDSHQVMKPSARAGEVIDQLCGVVKYEKSRVNLGQ